MAELISGDVPSVLTGATETQRPPDTLESKPPFAMAGNQDALQLKGITQVKSKPPFAMAGNQDALQLSGITPVFAVGMQERGGGGERSAGVSHAAGPLLTHTHYDGLMGVTTPPRGKQRDDYEGRRLRRAE